MSTLQSLPPASPPPLPFDPALPPALRTKALIEALPEPLRAVLAGGRVERRSRFTEDGFTGLREDWTPPATVTPRHAAMARRALADLDGEVLAPAPANHLLGRVLALLSHYPAKATTPDVERLLAMDWADDLGEFPAWAIDAAARIWRRSRKWRPSIAEIRGLCEDACAAERQLADRLRAVAQAGEAASTDRSGDRQAAPVHRLLTGAVRRMPG